MLTFVQFYKYSCYVPTYIYHHEYYLFQSLGNHEFDIGIDGLTPFVENLTCPVLAANLDLRKVPKLANEANLKKSVVFDITGTKIGIVGYLTPTTKYTSQKNDVEYIDEITAIRLEVTELQNEGAKIIIALGHSGYLKDLEIAEKVDGLDLVIGGHSHSLLWSGPVPDAEESQGPYPTYVKQSNGRTVPVVQSYAYTKYLGKIHLVFNAEGELVSSDGEPILLDKTIPQDPDIVSILDRYRTNLENITEEVLGKTSVLLDGRSCEKNECNLGNLITDSMIYHYASLYKGEHWTDVPIAMIQAGGIRASIVHEETLSEITKGELLTVMPFQGKLATVTMNGTILLQMLEHSVSNYNAPRVREFLQVSGIRVVYDYKKPVGSRVVKAIVRCSACSIPKYSNIEPKEIYKVILPDLLTDGADGFVMLKGLPIKHLPYGERRCATHYIKNKHLIFPEIEGRITILNRDVHKNSSPVTLSSLLPVAILILINFL